jgi:acetylornithine deacetylase/succinyl-diaminopimelate desuccinylase-like protein
MQTSPVLAHIDADLPNAISRLQDLLRIRSISTDPAFKAECLQAAEWLARDLGSFGITASVRPTPGHPMVVGHVAGPKGAPHVLFYGHYDVQPVDPLDLWQSDPFDPAITEGPHGPTIQARGASDDKGQLMTFVEATRAWQAVHGALPCSITFLFEGEEESSSPSLVPFLQDNAAELQADLALICDTGLFQSKTPAIMTMLRGMMPEELTIHGPSRDLHSGMYGGVAMNPIRVLSKILGNMHDDQGRITIPHFYDGVPDLPAQIAADWQALNFDTATFLGDVGLSQPAGEADRTALEMIWSRPTAEINGIWGGYTGAGFKTVLPAQAHAKVSFRLVGQQDPEAIRAHFRAWVQAQLPKDCRAEFHLKGGASGSLMATDHPIFAHTRDALGEEWGEPAAFVGCGGSIPIAGHFKDILGMDALLTGFARDDDNIHSPNEKYDIECFHKGIRSWARLLGKLAQAQA